MNTPSLALPDTIAVSLDIVSKESLAEKIISVKLMGVLLKKTKAQKQEADAA